MDGEGRDTGEVEGTGKAAPAGHAGLGFLLAEDAGFVVDQGGGLGGVGKGENVDFVQGLEDLGAYQFPELEGFVVELARHDASGEEVGADVVVVVLGLGGKPLAVGGGGFHLDVDAIDGGGVGKEGD